MTRSRLTIWFICCLAINSTIAQQIWNNTYIADRPIMLFSSVQTDTEGYTITGGTYGYINNLGKGLVARIGVNGNIEQYNIFIDSVYEPYATITNSLINTYSSELAFCGYSYTNLAYLLFCVTDKEANNIKTFRYYTPNTLAYHGYSVAYTNDHFYVTGVRTDSSTNNPNVCFVKIDTAGVRVMEMNYGTTWYEQASSIIKLTNGNLMIGAVRSNLNLNPTVQQANTWLLEVDTGGNVVRQWFDPSDSTYVAEGLRQTQDGGFIYGAQKKSYQTVNDVYKTSTIVKLDSNFNKQWVFDSDTLSPTGFTDIEILPDGNYIACGSKNYRYGWIVKLSANGQKLWSKEYVGIGDWGSKNFLRDIDVLPDGGLIAVGESQLSGATPPQVGWFLKLDSNGCEIDNCTVGFEDVQEEKQIEIYPNPASDNFTIKLPESMKGAEVVVYDVTGKIVKQQTVNTKQLMIDVTAFSKGLYFATAQKGDRILSTKLVVE